MGLGFFALIKRTVLVTLVVLVVFGLVSGMVWGLMTEYYDVYVTELSQEQLTNLCHNDKFDMYFWAANKSYCSELCTMDCPQEQYYLLLFGVNNEWPWQDSTSDLEYYLDTLGFTVVKIID